MCAVRLPYSTKSDRVWLEWCLAEIFWCGRSYPGNIRGSQWLSVQNREISGRRSAFRPRFTAVGLPDSTKSDRVWLKWCLAEIFWCRRSYLGNIGGHSGFLYKTRRFLAAAMVFRPRFTTVGLPDSTKSDRVWLKWCLAELFWCWRSYFGNIRGYGGCLHQNGSFSGVPGPFRPRFALVKPHNLPECENLCPRWGQGMVYHLSGTYLSNIGGYGGSRHQNRIFRGRLGAFRATLGSRESSNAPGKCLEVFHHVGITCI